MIEQKAELHRARGLGWAAILGAITVAILLWLGLTGPSAGCVDKESSATVAFQAARSSEDLANIFGSVASHCRSGIVDRLITGTQADLLMFIPIYSAFLISILVVLRKRNRMIILFLTAALFITVSGDVSETFTQLQILDNVDNGANFLGSLATGNGLKTVGLSLMLLGIASVLWKDRTWISGTTAGLLGLLAIGRLAGYMIEGAQPLAPLSALAAYIVLTGYAGLSALAPVAKQS